MGCSQVGGSSTGLTWGIYRMGAGYWMGDNLSLLHMFPWSTWASSLGSIMYYDDESTAC